MPDEAQNTDVEIWRGPDEGNGSFYADSIHVTKQGSIGIDCGGHVIVMPVRSWHALAAAHMKMSMKEQEPLGADFEAAIFDNVVDLYEK